MYVTYACAAKQDQARQGMANTARVQFDCSAGHVPVPASREPAEELEAQHDHDPHTSKSCTQRTRYISTQGP